LTLDNVGDTSALPRLLDQIDVPVSHFLADGAYDGVPTSELLKARFGGAVEIIIPPPRNATPSPPSVSEFSFRDRYIPKFKPMVAWLGKPAAVIINAAE